MSTSFGGLTQSEAYVQQLALHNPTLYKWAFGPQSTNLMLGTMSSILNNPAYTGVKTSTVADSQWANAQIAEWDRKYGDLVNWGANASPIAGQLMKESTTGIQLEIQTGQSVDLGGGLGALGVLMGIGNLLPETPAIGAAMGYDSLI